MNHDVVYLLKNDIKADELRYSLRSIEKNFPLARVWFFGGCPAGIEPDQYVNIRQRGLSKWMKSTGSLKAACKMEELSADFWLFNDDFFILEKVYALPYMYRGTLKDRVDGLRKKRRRSDYADQLERTAVLLERNGCDTRDYALHVPMLINKAKALEVFRVFPDCPMFRSLYGNFWNVGGVQSKDVKIYDLQGEPAPGQQLVSTCDQSFKNGDVGAFIRSRFTDSCKWESNNGTLHNA